MTHVKPWIPGIEPYKPGKPIEELERELGIKSATKLASNENPLGPSPKALAAIAAAAARVNRYPDGASFKLRTKLAKRLGVAGNQLVFGCGGDEIFELMAKSFIGPGDEVVYAWPSFAMYPIVTKGMGGTPVPVPLTPALVHDLPAMRAAITPRTRVVMVCNPNNPTGTSVGRTELDAFVASLPADVLLLIDEAYYEFVRRADFPDSLAWVAKRPGTLIMRTFSKIYGLAGLRIGYGIGPADLVDLIDRLRDPFNVNHLAQVAALGALDDDEHVRASRELNRAGLDFLSRVCRALSLPFVPSHANFLLVEVGDGAHAFQALLRAGVIVRPVGGYGFPGHVRVSIGTPEENTVFAQALAALLGRSGTAAAQLVQPPLEARGGAGG